MAARTQLTDQDLLNTIQAKQIRLNELNKTKEVSEAEKEYNSYKHAQEKAKNVVIKLENDKKKILKELEKYQGQNIKGKFDKKIQGLKESLASKSREEPGAAAQREKMLGEAALKLNHLNKIKKERDELKLFFTNIKKILASGSY